MRASIFFACLWALVSCGGESLFGGGDAGGGGAGGAGNGGSGAGGNGTSSVSTGGASGDVCPPEEPRDGGSCMKIGQECEYGDGPLVFCRATYKCSFPNALWIATYPGCSSHPDQTGCPGGKPNPGSGCGQDGQLCLYGLTQCGCTMCPGGPCSLNPVWLCADPPGGGCPDEAPNFGQPCTPHGLRCTYGACGINTQAQRVCSGGVWVDVPVACPQ